MLERDWERVVTAGRLERHVKMTEKMSGGEGDDEDGSEMEGIHRELQARCRVTMIVVCRQDSGRDCSSIKTSASSGDAFPFP